MRRAVISILAGVIALSLSAFADHTVSTTQEADSSVSFEVEDETTLTVDPEVVEPDGPEESEQSSDKDDASGADSTDQSDDAEGFVNGKEESAEKEELVQDLADEDQEEPEMQAVQQNKSWAPPSGESRLSRVQLASKRVNLGL